MPTVEIRYPGALGSVERYDIDPQRTATIKEIATESPLATLARERGPQFIEKMLFLMVPGPISFDLGYPVGAMVDPPILLTLSDGRQFTDKSIGAVVEKAFDTVLVRSKS